MITLIRTMFQGDRKRQPTATDVKRKRHLAACVLLLESAHADDKCTQEEMDRIVASLRQRFSLSPEDANKLLELAARERQNSIDLWTFTNDLNQHLCKEEKLAVLEDIWGVIFADGRLSSHEDHLAHKLANLLRLTHQELIEAKLAAKARS